MQKLVSRKMCKLCKDLQKHVVVEVDGKKIELPPVEGIIILNILRCVLPVPNRVCEGRACVEDPDND
jgi:hypothetical protein